MSHVPQIQQGLKLAHAAKIALAVGAVSTIAFCLVVQNKTWKRLNEERSTREKVYAALQADIRVKQAQVAQLKTPSALQRRIAVFKLDVAEIQEDQIVRMYDGPVTRAGEVSPKLARVVLGQGEKP